MYVDYIVKTGTENDLAKALNSDCKDELSLAGRAVTRLFYSKIWNSSKAQQLFTAWYTGKRCFGEEVGYVV